MKQILMLLMSSVVVTTLAACGSGNGSSSNAAVINLPEGAYNVVYTTPIPSDACFQLESDTMISNGSGQVSFLESSIGINLNIAENPCLTYSDEENGVTASLSWSNCELGSSNILTARQKITLLGPARSMSCAYTVTATPQ